MPAPVAAIRTLEHDVSDWRIRTIPAPKAAAEVNVDTVQTGSVRKPLGMCMSLLQAR